MLYKLAALGAILAAVSYYIGLFDRPEFVLHQYLLASKEELIALVAPTTQMPFHKHVPRLCDGTLDAIQKLSGASELLAKGAAAYGSPDGAEKLGVGLYFDDPFETKEPRWAIGWVVGVSDFAKAKDLAARATQESGLEESIVAVRIGPGPSLKASIPWRIMLTPAIQPLFQWTRAFNAYDAGNYSAQGRTEDEGPIACEIYVTGPNDSYDHIDYVVLMGDVRNTWADLFPEGANSKVDEK